jgi:hypothetical protein
VNAGSRPDTFTLDVYDATGTLRKTFKKTVAARNLHWFSLLAEHPDLAGISGQIRLHTPGFRAAALSLQFASHGAFTALPMVHTYGM